MESDDVTTRVHARSRRGKTPTAPRTFTAATGLTGATPEELAKRAEITAAALAAAERSEARAAKMAALAKLVVPSPPTKAAPPERSQPQRSSPKTRSTESVAGPVARPPAEPKALVPHGVRTARPRVEAPVSPSPAPEVGAAATSPKGSKESKGLRGLGLALPWAARGAVDRPARVFKLPELGNSSGGGADTSASDHVNPVVGLADGVTIAEALRGDEPTRSAPHAGSDSADRATAGQVKTAAAPPKVKRAPKGSGSWHRRAHDAKEVSRSRPASPARPTPSAASPERASSSNRWALPLIGGKKPATPTASTVSPTSSRRKLLSRRAKAGQTPPNKKKAESRRAQRKQAKKKTSSTPLERRRRIPVALAGVFALAILATNFPLSSILGQHHQLAVASAQLEQVQQQNKALTEQENALKSNVAINELARGDLQMVTPGQTLYDVLPPSNKTDTTTPGAPTFGDPGSQPLVAPNNAPDLSPQQVLPTPIPATAAGASASASAKGATATGVSSNTAAAPTPSSYWGRVADTLEFWR